MHQSVWLNCAKERWSVLSKQSEKYVVNGIPVEIERKKVRRFNLRVRRDGTAHLSIPRRANFCQAYAFLDTHAEWLRNAVERTKRAAQEQEASLNNEGKVPLWGELVPLPEGLGVDELYRQEMEKRLPAVISRMEYATGLHAAGWQLRAMTSRWGSCTPQTGNIRINLRLAAYPPKCLAYVVAHELTHLAEPSHNARFHELLGRVVPDEKDVRALLRANPSVLARKKSC